MKELQKCSVESFYHPITFRVVGGCTGLANAKCIQGLSQNSAFKIDQRVVTKTRNGMEQW